jgi:hypothetical protein
MMADPFLTVAISIGSSSTRGLFDQLDELAPNETGGQAQVRSNVVTIKKGSLAGIAIDVAITVDGTSYKVREQALSDDGLLQHIKVA